MPRHPEQDAALGRYYQRRKDETRAAFEEAMDRLLRGESLYTDGKLSEANLCREAKRSRATLNRYQDIKQTFTEGKKHPDKTAPTSLAEKIRELEQTLRQYRRGDNRAIRELKESRDRLAQETFIQHLIIKMLQREKDALELKLQEALRGRRLHVVPGIED